MHAAASELVDLLGRRILPFWAERSPDRGHGGFLTNFDGHGRLVDGRHDKYLNTQARLVWSFTELATVTEDPDRYIELAREGVGFLVERFFDAEFGGWYWKVARDGSVLDDAKLTYGQSFALYALACHARHTGDQGSADLALATFDALEAHVRDEDSGGWWENMARDWRRAGPGSAAGDRKSLDIHMHLLEAFAELVRLTGEREHVAALREVRELITTVMVDRSTGAGGNQFSGSWEPLLPIVIDKTWIAERPAAEHPPAATEQVTSYGHNLELAWLLADADVTLGEAGASDGTIAPLADHALRWGYDREHGGVFREGPYDAPPTDRDKEFWQNSEALVGWLEGFRVTGDVRYLDAFERTWDFAKQHFVHPEFGEWRVRVSAEGTPLVDDLGNDWKVCYHTGRACLEAARRLERLGV